MAGVEIGEGFEGRTALVPLSSLLGNCSGGTGTVPGTCTGTVPLPCQELSSVFDAAIADMGGEGNDIAAGLGAKAVEGALGRGDYQSPPTSENGGEKVGHGSGGMALLRAAE